jgi:hypothetical protein
MKLGLTENVSDRAVRHRFGAQRSKCVLEKKGTLGSINRNSTVVVASLRLKTSIGNFDHTEMKYVLELKSKDFCCAYKSSFMKC